MVCASLYYRYFDPNFEKQNPIHNWHYPLTIFTDILFSINRLIERFGNDSVEQLTINLAPILSEFNLLMKEVFQDT